MARVVVLAVPAHVAHHFERELEIDGAVCGIAEDDHRAGDATFETGVHNLLWRRVDDDGEVDDDDTGPKIKITKMSKIYKTKINCVDALG